MKLWPLFLQISSLVDAKDIYSYYSVYGYLCINTLSIYVATSFYPKRDAVALSFTPDDTLT